MRHNGWPHECLWDSALRATGVPDLRTSNVGVGAVFRNKEASQAQWPGIVFLAYRQVERKSIVSSAQPRFGQQRANGPQLCQGAGQAAKNVGAVATTLAMYGWLTVFGLGVDGKKLANSTDSIGAIARLVLKDEEVGPIAGCVLFGESGSILVRTPRLEGQSSEYRPHALIASLVRQFEKAQAKRDAEAKSAHGRSDTRFYRIEQGRDIQSFFQPTAR